MSIMMHVALLLACLGYLQNEQVSKDIDPKAASVISKFIEAKGGEATLKKTKNYKLEGEVVSGNRPVFKFEIYQAPGRHLSINRFSNGAVRQHGTNGKIAWSLDANGKPNILRGQAAKDYIREYETLHESLEWTKQFKSILYAGEKTVDTVSVDHLIFVASDNRQINRYFSKETGLLVREEQLVENNGKTELLTSKIRNYVREKNGTMVSRSRLNHYGSGDSFEFKINATETNTLSDQTIFDIPKAVAELNGDNAK